MYSKEAFVAFANGQGTRYPWNSLRRTRNSYFCKWLITTGATTSLFTTNIFHLVPTSTLPKEYTTAFIVEDVGIPVPPEFDDIIDTISYWGTCQSNLWTGKVLHVLVHSYLLGTERPDRKKMCFSFIAILLHEHVGMPIDTPQFEDMMYTFFVHYQSAYNHAKHFHELTIDCQCWHFHTYLAITPTQASATANVVSSNVVSP